MSSTAQHVEDLLLDFAYGELSASDAQRVQAHLDGCAECRTSLEQMQGVRKVMSQLPHEAAPDAGLESLLAYAEQAARRTQAGPQPKPTWWRKLLAPATAVAAIAVIGVVAHEVQKEAPTPEQVVDSAIAQREEKTYFAEPSPAEAVPAQAPAPAAPAAEKKKAEGARRERASVTRAAPMKDLAEGMIAGGAELERQDAPAAPPPPVAAPVVQAPMGAGPMAAAPRPEPAPIRKKMAAVDSAPPMAQEYDRAYAEKRAMRAAETATNAFVTASPTATQLSAQAQAAHDRGDLREEARLLREAVDVAPRERVLRGNLLLRLCDAEYQLGNAAAGARACQRAADEFPGTSTALAAQRRIADHGGRERAADVPAATSAPAKARPPDR